jgi:hypothetical protein
MISRTVTKIVDRCQQPGTTIGEECRGPSRGLYESLKAHPPYRSGALEGYKPGAFFGPTSRLNVPLASRSAAGDDNPTHEH